MRILHVCSELYPILKTGGLADVVAALPPALAKLGCDSRVVVPGFPAFMDPLVDRVLIAELGPKFGVAKIQIYLCTLPHTDIKAYIIDAPSLYKRPGNPYTDADNNAYKDNYKRFALLSFVAVLLADKLDKDWSPQVIHGHDWHAGLVAAYLKAHELKYGKRLAGSIFTVHNLAYQGLFPESIFAELELPSEFFDINGLEFYGKVSFLKAGLFFSDKLTTVSPTYAGEIQSQEQGCGLDGLLSSRRSDLTGILNGVDSKVWNPASDKLLRVKYTPRFMGGKLKCKLALQKQVGIRVKKDALLFAIVTRLTEQKGLGLVLAGIPEIIKHGGQLVVLGSGDKSIEVSFQEVAQEFPMSVSVQLGYDEDQAHRVIAGADVILVPSRFEPCGLTQLYGLKYGTLPLVRKVGGLADSVTDVSLENLADETATGFVFDRFDVPSFNAAIRRAFTLYRDQKQWHKVERRAMLQNFSWDLAAQKFMALYQQVCD